MKIDRLISIIMMMLEHRTVRAQTLADRFEVSLRTIYRDLDALNKAGIPVNAVPGVNGGFSIIEEYKITHRLLTVSDITTLLIGLKNIGSLIDNKALQQTLTRINSLVPQEKRQSIELMSNQLIVDLNPWLGNHRIITHLDTIKKALNQHCLLRFSYTNRLGENSLRTVEPYQLMMKENHWYLRAYSLEKQDFRLFKLTRIKTLEIKPDCFSPRKLPALTDLQEKMRPQQCTIKLAIHHSILDKVLEYCTEEDISPYDKDWFIVNFPFVADDFGYHLLLTFGSYCVCLSPDHIRLEMKNRIQSIEKRYQDNTFPLHQ